MRKFIIYFLLICAEISFGQNHGTRATQLEFRSLNKIIRVSLDSSKYDKDMGYSCRLLQIFTHFDNKLILTKQILLPINRSWDYDYKLYDKFEGDKKFAVVQGTWMFFIFDMNTDSLTEAFVPQFPYQDGIDAQTGQLRNLKLSKDGRIFSGEKLDFGNFSYDLTNPLNPKQIKLPIK